MNRGASARLGGRVLVPFAKTIRVTFPRRGALVWNRPAGVEVEERGELRFLPVPDWTRRIQWALLAAAAAVFLLSRFFRGR